MGVAQQVAQRSPKPPVEGSSPSAHAQQEDASQAPDTRLVARRAGTHRANSRTAARPIPRPDRATPVGANTTVECDARARPTPLSRAWSRGEIGSRAGLKPRCPRRGASQFDSGRDHFAFVAQVVVLPTFNRRVVGSSPTGGTSCAQQRHDQNHPIVGRLLPGVRRHRIHQGEMHPTNRRCRRRPGSPDHRDRLQRRGGRRAGVPGRALPARSAESGPNAAAGGAMTGLARPASVSPSTRRSMLC